LVFMPLISCIAFTWDGIYIGATASKSIRNTMILSAISFFAVYYGLQPIIGIHALLAGYFTHLAVRTILMTLNSKKQVLARV
jgi:multidrug resistance protein, MATE family